MRSISSTVPSIVKNILSNMHNIQYLEEFATAGNFAEIADLVIPLLKAEPLYYNLPKSFSDVCIIGDLHGSYTSLSKLLSLFFSEQISSFIFLGDYVDRGKHSLVSLLLIFAAKIAFPKHIILLRGNHETPRTNQKYGFKSELEHLPTLSADEAAVTYALANKVFTYLSLVARTPNGSFCVHGGVPFSLTVERIAVADINTLSKPLDIRYHSIDVLMQSCMELLWNDPREDQVIKFKSSPRGTGKTFNETAVNDFLSHNNLQRVIRAHEATRGAYQLMFDGKLIHIFTSEPYFGKIPVGMLVHETSSVTFIRNLQFEVVETIA